MKELKNHEVVEDMIMMDIKNLVSSVPDNPYLNISTNHTNMISNDGGPETSTIKSTKSGHGEMFLAQSSSDHSKYQIIAMNNTP